VSAGAAAAAAGVPAEKSPHMKTSYDAVEFDTLADVFEGLKWRVISKPGGATVKPDDFYRCGRLTIVPSSYLCNRFSLLGMLRFAARQASAGSSCGVAVWLVEPQPVRLHLLHTAYAR
jgi:hypothetical protein